MSAHQWKPGDVAEVPGFGRVFADDNGIWCTSSRRTSTPWRDLGDGRVPFPDIRPLVVIDPEDPATVEALAHAWRAAESTDLDNEQPMTMAALRMQAALRSLITPPKPDEPQGLGAVVEDADGATWLRDWKGFWRRPKVTAAWSEVKAVHVLSEGWSE